MDDDDEDRDFVSQSPVDNVDHDTNDQVVPQQILAENVVEIESVDNVDQTVSGQAQPVNYFPVDLQNPIQPPSDFDVDLNGHQPMETHTNIDHPNIEGGLDVDLINDLIVYHVNIEFSPTVFVAYPDYPGDDEDHNEIVFDEEVEEVEYELVPANLIDEIIKVVLMEEPMEMDDPLVDYTNNTTTDVMTNNVDENTTVPIVIQTETENHIEDQNETLPPAASGIAAPEASPNDQERPNGEPRNEATDHRTIAHELGSKSVERQPKVSSDEDLLIQRSRSQSLS